MKKINVPKCPVSNEPGYIFISKTIDAFFNTKGIWQYKRNPRTGHLWLDPRPDLENISDLYTDYYTHEKNSINNESSWQKAISLILSNKLGYEKPAKITFTSKIISILPTVKDAALMDVLRIPATTNGAILDIGCGSGALLLKLRKAGWETIGIEPDPNAAAHLTDDLGFTVFSNIDDIKSSMKKFDLITLNHVLEHLPDPINTLQIISTFLAPNGRIVITTPNVESLASKIFKSYWRGLEPPRHFNLFSTISLTESLQISGFNVEEVSTHTRLARGIFYLSLLAFFGKKQIETNPPTQLRSLTIAGYLFQILEECIIKIIPNLGEEIYASASLKDTTEIS